MDKIRQALIEKIKYLRRKRKKMCQERDNMRKAYKNTAGPTRMQSAVLDMLGPDKSKVDYTISHLIEICKLYDDFDIKETYNDPENYD